jgi:hypothetical protein
VVVLITPGSQSTPDIVQRPEPACVEALVAQPSVEALDMAVLHRLARLDVDLPVLGPADHEPRGELRAVSERTCPGRPRSATLILALKGPVVGTRALLATRSHYGKPTTYR